MKASLSISVKNEEMWQALKPAILYLIKETQFFIKFESEISCLLSFATTEDAEMAHTLLHHYKFPVSMSLDVVYHQ